MNDPFEILHDELVRVATAPAMLATRPHVGSPRRSRSARWLRRPLVLAVVLVGASASAGGLALAGTFSQTAEDPQAWVNGQRVTPEQTIAPDQSADLEILRRPRVASDALPPDAVQLFTNSPAAANGPNVALARRAQGFDASAGAAYVIPGDGRICLLAQGGGTCQPDAIVNEGRMSFTTGGASIPGTAVAGVVPDGVNQVTITGGGGSVTVPVHENVYMAIVQGGVASVTFQGPNGPVTVGE